LKRFKLSILAAIGLAIVSLMSISNIPKLDVKASDKIGHFVAYAVFAAILSYEGYKSFRSSNKTARLLTVSALTAAGYGTMMEFFQALPMFNRHFEVLDMLANTTGAALGAILFGLFLTLKRA